MIQGISVTVVAEPIARPATRLQEPDPGSQPAETTHGPEPAGERAPTTAKHERRTVTPFAGIRPGRPQASPGFASHAGPRRRGSFGDTDRKLIVDHRDGTKPSRVIGDRGLRRLVRRAALDVAASDRLIDDLNMSDALGVVDDTEAAADDAHANVERAQSTA